MLILELRDPGAGVLARSYRTDDCVRFLRRSISRKRQEAASLRSFDSVSAAIVEAEIVRLEQLIAIALSSLTAPLKSPHRDHAAHR